MTRRLIMVILCVLAASTVLGACGSTPPEAPLAQAKKLDASTSDISTACGEVYQMTFFGPPPAAQLVAIRHSASFDARKLLTVYARNPAWIYQGETVRLIVTQAISMLRNCGLRGSAAILEAGAARH